MTGPLEPVVSIIIPHYQTVDLAKLCLRAIRKYTCDIPFEVIVVDNNSQDNESLCYLRTVDWIRLIERTKNVGLKGKGHKEAIDIGISKARGKYVLSFHTDTIPIREDWLTWHVEQLETEPPCAAVGTYKLELKSNVQKFLKYLELALFWKWKQKFNDTHYIRSHCALYDKATLAELNLKYDDPEGDVAGRSIHFGLLKSGHQAKLLSIDETLERVVHLNHGTMIMRPELGARKNTIQKGLSRLLNFFARPEIQKLLNDNSLDLIENDVEGSLLVRSTNEPITIPKKIA